MTPSPRIALCKTFLNAYAKLPKSVQKKTWQFIDKFQSDARSSGINFETIEGSADDKLRSVRIDLAYRAILVHPPRGDVFLCVWIDHHDEAYAWARHKRFDVHPSSGALQVYDVEYAVGAPSGDTPTAETKVFEQKPLFAGFDDEDLLIAGVPVPLLPSVRALRFEHELDTMAPHLPEDAAESLYGLAAGMSLSEAIASAARPRLEEPVDTEDFSAALARPETQRTFLIADGETELANILDAPLEQWRLFLHPSQRQLVDKATNGPTRVLGGAGTGKTVVLMHRADRLARQLGRDDKILVTTFTRNLAHDLRTNLTRLCGDRMQRIEVENLHAWAAQFLLRHNHRVAKPTDRDREDAMDVARAQEPIDGLPATFSFEEWDRIVQAQEILDESAYLKARRTGRGHRLNRALRKQVWKVFAAYRTELDRRGLLEEQDVIREARLLIEKQGRPPFRAVCADETQDFTPAELRLIRALAPHGPDDLFLVGDGHQRIYGAPAPLSRSGIEIRGRSRRLRLNYRTTEQIARFGLAIIQGVSVDDLDDGEDTLLGYTSLRQGKDPESHLFADEQEEADFIVARVQQWLGQGVRPEDICLATRANDPLAKRYGPLLAEADIAHAKITREGPLAGRGVRLATMHRLKGLEFPCILLAGVQRGRVPPTYQSQTADPSLKREAMTKERCLLYVACTRARDALVVCGHGKPSPLMRG
ncbi:MAG: DEAD/DEAH box helicase [Planctomycetota bacterium]|nr:DEAD/DEAH box helicase [Planctomycetota bacterium]